MFTWVDWTIIGITGLFALHGLDAGLLQVVSRLLTILASFYLSLRWSGTVEGWLGLLLALPKEWLGTLSYLAVAVLSEALIGSAFQLILSRVSVRIQISKPSKIFGALVSGINALVFISFTLVFISVIPIRTEVKKDVLGSPISTWLVTMADTYGGGVRSTLSEVAKEATRFVTITPSSHERIELNDIPLDLEVRPDQKSERDMFELINRDRVGAGVPILMWDERVAEVARSYSRDMFHRRFFSHSDPEGKDASDRLTAWDIAYVAVGENLAYALDAQTAHTGLMNSAGHKKNILDIQFLRVGIGVVDGGLYGKMFTQIFVE